MIYGDLLIHYYMDCKLKMREEVEKEDYTYNGLHIYNCIYAWFKMNKNYKYCWQRGGQVKKWKWKGYSVHNQKERYRMRRQEKIEEERKGQLENMRKTLNNTICSCSWNYWFLQYKGKCQGSQFSASTKWSNSQFIYRWWTYCNQLLKKTSDNTTSSKWYVLVAKESFQRVIDGIILWMFKGKSIRYLIPDLTNNGIYSDLTHGTSIQHRIENGYTP